MTKPLWLDGFWETDETQIYRYKLERTWARPGDRMCFIMLNPSTADGMKDDPTIRRCIAFAKREGYGGISVVNLFALRCTRPVHLWDHPDPVGPRNRDAIAEACEESARIVAAWGAGVDQAPTCDCRPPKALSDLSLWCLGTTKEGHPRHPLYVRADEPLVRWEP